jgi:hypothetical protein
VRTSDKRYQLSDCDYRTFYFLALLQGAFARLSTGNAYLCGFNKNRVNPIPEDMDAHTSRLRKISAKILRLAALPNLQKSPTSPEFITRNSHQSLPLSKIQCTFLVKMTGRRTDGNAALIPRVCHMTVWTSIQCLRDVMQKPIHPFGNSQPD